MLVDDDGRVRYFTVREAARLQTFPDTFNFNSSWTENMRQLGNAVPCDLARIAVSSVVSAINEQRGGARQTEKRQVCQMDSLTPDARSRVMARVRGRGNLSTELRIIALFRLWKITGWRRNQRLFGRPDFVFKQQKVALFVDGDFWHGHPHRGRMPKSNVDFWIAKISANRRRDRKVNAVLRGEGWTVLRVWESSLKERPATVANRILASL